MIALRVLMRISITPIKSFIFFAIHLEFSLDSRSCCCCCFACRLLPNSGASIARSSCHRCIWDCVTMVVCDAIAQICPHGEYTSSAHYLSCADIESHILAIDTTKTPSLLSLQYLRFNSNWFIYNALVDSKIAYLRAPNIICLFKEPRLFSRCRCSNWCSKHSPYVLVLVSHCVTQCSRIFFFFFIFFVFAHSPSTFMVHWAFLSYILVMCSVVLFKIAGFRY